MSEWVWILIAVLVVVLLGVVGWSLSRRRTSARLKEQFGPEYDRTVGELGEQRAAEADLLEREKKRKKLEIVDLTPETRQEHAATWQKVQTEFVDAPHEAVGRAERLVTRVMRERGYPIDDFDQRAARHLRRSPRHRGELPQCSHDLSVGAQRGHRHRAGQAGVRALPRPLRPITRGRIRNISPTAGAMNTGGRPMTTHETRPETVEPPPRPRKCPPTQRGTRRDSGGASPQRSEAPAETAEAPAHAAEAPAEAANVPPRRRTRPSKHDPPRVEPTRRNRRSDKGSRIRSGPDAVRRRRAVGSALTLDGGAVGLRRRSPRLCAEGRRAGGRCGRAADGGLLRGPIATRGAVGSRRESLDGGSPYRAQAVSRFLRAASRRLSPSPGPLRPCVTGL